MLARREDSIYMPITHSKRGTDRKVYRQISNIIGKESEDGKHTTTI